MRFHSFYTENLPEQIIHDHQKCCEKVGVEVHYHKYPEFETYDDAFFAHGDFMTKMMQEETDDVVCFLDVDCLPTNKDILFAGYQWAKENHSFVGNAQNISHMQLRNYFYSAPGLTLLSKKGWERVGSPSLRAFHQNDTLIDTIHIVSLRADQIAMDYQLMYPVGFDGDEGPPSRLGSYGYYGKGTLYPASWHYFRISDFIGKENLPELWTKRVNDIMNDRQIIPRYTSRYY